MTAELVSVASVIVMSVVTFCVVKIYFAVMDMKPRASQGAVMNLPQHRDFTARSKGRERKTINQRVGGNRLRPQEHDERLC